MPEDEGTGILGGVFFFKRVLGFRVSGLGTSLPLCHCSTITWQVC